MANQVTLKMLQSWATMINKTTGNPLTYGTKTAEGLKPNGGHYFIEKAPQGYRLVQLMDDGSFGEHHPLGHGSYSKSMLYDLLRAFWEGIEVGKGLITYE